MTTPLRVLILEDRDADALLVVHELRQAGFDPTWTVVVTEEDYLSRLEPSLDVILADYSMPQFDAPRALRLLRDRGLDVPFLIVSGSIGEDTAVAAIKEGAADYLLKDRLGRLGEAVRQALDQKRLRNEKRRAEEMLLQRTRLALLSADVGLALTRSDTLQEMLRHCAGAMVRNLDAALTRVWTLNPAENVLELRASAGLYTHLEGAHHRVPVGELDVGLIARERAPYVTNDVGHDPRLRDSQWAQGAGLVAFAGYPLLVEDRLVGVMALFARQPLGEAALAAIGTAANQVALGIERKAAEEALREREEQVRLLLDSTGEAIYGLDLRGRCTFCNSACVRLLGYDDPGRLLGQNMHALMHHSRRDGSPYPEEECLVYQAFRRGEGAHVDDEVLWRADGTSFPAEYWSYPVRRGSEVVGAVVTFLDLSERRQLEEQLRQSQKMEAVGRLAGGVAHDFNNLLTVITGYGELLLTGLRPGDPLRDGIAEILKASERAAALTRQLLAFGRRQVLQPVTLDLGALVAGMEKMLHRLIGEDLELLVSSGPGQWPVKADLGQLEQVVMNLIVNARDAMPTGGKLTIETCNIELSPAYAALHPEAVPGEYVLLAITDTGHGMDEATRVRVFEPFFTTKEVGKGTGLGLATVHGIVKQSGGRIEVYSEPGHGTTFRIYLPRDAGPAPARRAEPVVTPPRRGTETVLLVEDEDGVRALARTVLAMNGYTVLEAPSGGDALVLAEQHPGPIHLLIADVVMPRMSGPHLGQRLASLRPAVRVLYLSGYTDNAIVHHGVLDPGTPFLQKPFGPEALAKKVREVLDA